jgi:Electron transfer DM13
LSKSKRQPASHSERWLPCAGIPPAFDDEFLSLGRLKANQGNQDYAIPNGVSLDCYRSVVIWCRRFTYAFGVAALG